MRTSCWICPLRRARRDSKVILTPRLSWRTGWTGDDLIHPDHEAEASDGRYRNDRPNAERENEKCQKLGSTPDTAVGGRQCGGVLGAVMHGRSSFFLPADGTEDHRSVNQSVIS